MADAKDCEVMKKLLEEQHLDIRKRANGTVKFIGELYKASILAAKIMIECTKRLMEQNVTEESLERVCKFLTTIGKKLEEEIRDDKAKSATFRGFFNTFKNMIKEDLSIESRIRFDILNLIDLRNNKWVHRENDVTVSKIKTMKEWKEEEAKESYIQQMNIDEFNRSHGMRPQNRRGNFHNNNNNNNKSYKKDDRYNSQQRGFDFKKLPSYVKMSSNNIKLGPTHSFQNFNRNCRQQQQQQQQSRSTNTVIMRSNYFADIPFASNRNNVRPEDHVEVRAQSPKIDVKSVEIEEPAEIQDLLSIDLNERENEAKKSLKADLDKYHRDKLTIDEVIENSKELNISKNVIGMILCDYLDQKTNARKMLCDVIMELLNQKMLIGADIAMALKMLMKAAPDLECDVPHVYKYISEYTSKSLIKAKFLFI
jgi:translation initiation factor 4G